MRELIAGFAICVIMPSILLAAIISFFSGAIGPGLGFLAILIIGAITIVGSGD